MGNYNPANALDPVHSTGDKGNAVIYHGKANASAALVIGDNVRPCRVAAGTLVHRVVIKTGALDTHATKTLAAKIGFQPIDGTDGDDDAVAAAGDFARTAATTTYELFPPVLVAKDSYLQVEVTANAATGATGAVEAKVEGDGIGAK